MVLGKAKWEQTMRQPPPTGTQPLPQKFCSCLQNRHSIPYDFSDRSFLCAFSFHLESSPDHHPHAPVFPSWECGLRDVVLPDPIPGRFNNLGVRSAKDTPPTTVMR